MPLRKKNNLVTGMMTTVTKTEKMAVASDWHLQKLNYQSLQGGRLSRIFPQRWRTKSSSLLRTGAKSTFSRVTSKCCVRGPPVLASPSMRGRRALLSAWCKKRKGFPQTLQSFTLVKEQQRARTRLLLTQKEKASWSSTTIARLRVSALTGIDEDCSD